MEILGEGALGFASWVVSVALRGLFLAAVAHIQYCCDNKLHYVNTN